MFKGEFEEVSATASVGFDVVIRNLGTSDEYSLNFSLHMTVSSLAHGLVEEAAAKGESIQDIPSLVNMCAKIIDDKAGPSLRTALARDACLQQVEFHLGKALEACHYEFGLEGHNCQYLHKAFNDIGDALRKLKVSQRS